MSMLPSEWALRTAWDYCRLDGNRDVGHTPDKPCRQCKSLAGVLDRVQIKAQNDGLRVAASLVHQAADGKKVVGIDTPCGAEKELRTLALAIEKLIL